MNRSTASQKLSYRIAAEAQLLAEEKWILEALAKIRIQRNCLQIERLELENMRAKLIKEMSAKKRNGNNRTGETNSAIVEQPSPAQSSRQEEFDLEKYLKEMETMCNDEKLDLKVSTPIYNKNINSDLDMEETEDEEIEDLEDSENVIVDMNMLMNGQT